jgi:hypothetical protein
MSEKANFRYIVPLEKLPDRKRSDGKIYAEIIQDFDNSGLKYAEVTLTSKNPLTVCAYLRNRVRETGIKTIRVRYLCKKVYLERENETIKSILTDFPLKVRTKGFEEKVVKEVKAGEILIIELKSETERNYGLFILTEQSRWFFPGYNIDFILETDLGELKNRVTSAKAGTQIGDPTAGHYLSGGLREWYRSHPEVVMGKKVTFECIEPYKRYRLSV